MRWSRSEIERLYPILERVSFDLAPVDGKNILVLCSGQGEVVFWLAEMMETGKVTGLELDQDALTIARRSAHEMGLEGVVAFQPAEIDHIALPDATFDAVVSEFIVHPSSIPTQVGRSEMRRVLKPGGRMVLTDVIVTKPLPQEVRDSLQTIGLDYLRDASQGDLKTWMTGAGLVNVQVLDLSSMVKNAWELRRAGDKSAAHWKGYSTLLEDDDFRLGKTIFYIYAKGEKT